MMKKFLGIDYGSKRVGVALSDDSGMMAFPNAVLENNNTLFTELEKIIKENSVLEIIVGESKNYKMQANVIMKDINIFCDKIKKEFNLPVHLEPEFLTSHQAEYFQGKTDMLDASAAAIILQSYLDKINNTKLYPFD